MGQSKPNGNIRREGQTRVVSTWHDRIVTLSCRPHFQVTGLARWISEALPTEPDRRLLRHRLVAKLTGARRGRLRLPLHFPSEVRKLSELTTSQLRNTVYALKADDRTEYRLEQPVLDFVHQVIPDGRIRTVRTDNSVHVRQRKVVKPLSESDWPRLETRPAWPSSPSLIESMVMARKGAIAPPLQKTANSAKHRIHWSEFNSNAELRARIIATNVVGIRSDISVPDKYLAHFRYRWNFLILTGAYKMPTGLVRFLTGQWIRNPHNLWLQDKTSFKIFLKKTERTRFACIQPGPW